MASKLTEDDTLNGSEIPGHVELLPKVIVPELPSDNNGKVPEAGTSQHKIQEEVVKEIPSQAICSDILFLENVIKHLKDIDDDNESIKTVITKLKALIRKKVRSLSTTGSGKCLEDSVELLHSKVKILRRTVMDKYWDELQSLRMGPNDRPDGHHGDNQRHAYRRSSRFDDSSYSPADSRTSRRDSFEDELSSKIDRLDHFITNKYKDDFREVRKNAMPRLHRRQSMGKATAEHSLAERILRSRKTNRNEYNTPRSVSDSRQMISPDSIYSRVSAGSSTKGNGQPGYDRGDVPHRSPPDGNSYHEEILDIVASFNDKTPHIIENGSIPSKPKPAESGSKQYRPGQTVHTKSNGHIRRGSDDPAHPANGFPQLDQPRSYKESSTQPHSYRESGNQPHSYRESGTQRHSHRESGTQSYSHRDSGTQPHSHRESGTQPHSHRDSGTQPHSHRESGTQPHSYRDSGTQPTRAVKAQVKRSMATKSVGTQSFKITPRTITDKKKKKKPRPPSPRSNRTSWMKTVNYEQGPVGKTCSCDHHNTQGEKSTRRKTEEQKRWEARPSYMGHHSPLEVNPGDISRPRVYGVMDTAREKEAPYELTAIHELNRRYDNRTNVNVNRRRQPSPHNGEKIFDYGVMKEKRFSPLYDEDYIRQYRSLQL